MCVKSKKHPQKTQTLVAFLEIPRLVYKYEVQQGPNRCHQQPGVRETQAGVGKVKRYPGFLCACERPDQCEPRGAVTTSHQGRAGGDRMLELVEKHPENRRHSRSLADAAVVKL